MTDVLWEEIPCLADAISKDDVHQKGKGQWAVDFVSWAKTALLMKQKAPGWLFELVKDPNGDLVHSAPNGTGFLVGVFKGPKGEVLPEFPYAITNNKNEPVQKEQVSSRVLSDQHRRAFCAACCWQFNLSYQLWAREEIEEPVDVSDPAPGIETQQKPVSSGKAGKKPSVGQPAAAPKGPGPINKADREELIAALGMARDLDTTAFSEFVNNFRVKFSLPSGQPIRDLITTQEHADFCNEFLNKQ